MPASPRSAARRTLAALGGAALTPALLLTSTPHALAQTAPERVILSPTADPSTSQTLTWRTAHDGDQVLEIAPQTAPDQVTRVPAHATARIGGTYHAATATGLEPGTAYRYRVGDGAQALTPWRTLTTPAPTAQPFDFLYFGDIQNDITEGAAPVVRAALAAEPDAELAVHSGDLIDTANSDAQWGEWFDALGADATGTLNHIAAPGNHEYSGSALSGHWSPQFPGAANGPTSGRDLPETVYHTDYQGVRFIVLNSNYRNAAPLDAAAWLDTQRRWLEQALSENPHRWTVVTFHHPVFSNSPGRDNAPVRDAWLDTLEEYDVDLVLQGHDHSYSRGNLVANRTEDPDVQTGPVYAVTVTGPKMYDVGDGNWTGNGAEARVQLGRTQTFQAVSVDGDTLEYEARTARGTVVDSFTIVKDQDGKRVTDTL
ncbi:metallophosphoesterase family protein [Nocardiopsis sp. CT-R113]|uniref:Metallophosphoesterase family protein n=1 Tax=Nocardiopsis codii TaxID=3065942 RepID=A0ABU7KG57_9ACTN|nr:metallophosphoesterase family protein [Nocardiopsis sp. CT-R113]MEE2041226.1 metallophosphoesterase family protein [Nocardiopsis sp. CT-R113]